MPDSSEALEVRPPDGVSDALDDILESPAVATALDLIKQSCGKNERKTAERLRANAILAMAQAKMTRQQIAKQLGVKPNAVRVALWRLRSKGLLRDLQDKLENDLTALAIDSAQTHLKAKDKEFTLEHLKGVGFYKNHSHAKHDGGAGFVMPPLQVNVVFNQGAQPIPGQAPDFSEAVVGVPRDDA
jgi:hypothetical protein